MRSMPADVVLVIKGKIKTFCQGLFWLFLDFYASFCIIFGVHIFLDYLVNFVIVPLDLRNRIK
jgi:hypothetical protein